MLSLLLLLLALFIGTIIQVITKAPSNQWRKVLEKMLISAAETAIIFGAIYILSLFDNQNRYSPTLISLQNVFLYYGLWVAFVSFECRQFLFPQLTESGLFLLHCISILTILPFIPLLLQAAPLIVLGLALISILLFVNCMTSRSLTNWEKLGLSVWYLILTLLNIVARFIPYLASSPLEFSFTITSWAHFFDWVINAGLLTHLLFHFFQLTALLPNKHTRWAGVRTQALFLVNKVSDSQANRSTILIQLLLIALVYIINSYLHLVNSNTLTAFLFLAIPLLDTIPTLSKDLSK